MGITFEVLSRSRKIPFEKEILIREVRGLQMILLFIFSICIGMLLGHIDLLAFTSLITDMTSFLVAGFRKIS